MHCRRSSQPGIEAYIAAWKVSSGTFRYAASLKVSLWGQGGVCSLKVKPTPPVATRQTLPKGDVVCYNCAESDHTSPHWPLRKPKSARLCYVPQSTPAVVLKPDKEPTISVVLISKPLTSLVDTGCACTLVQSQYITRESNAFSS